MKNRTFLIGLIFLLNTVLLSSCGSGSKQVASKSNSKSKTSDGQLHGVAPSSRGSMGRPYGMVYIPPGTFHMGPSDEDVNYNYTARNKSVSINGFWMDATEVTNNEYRQFVQWVRDSLAAVELGYFKTSSNGDTDRKSVV